MPRLVTSFSDISPDQIKLDCRFYTGYKPCHRFDGCPDCPHFEARGTEILIIKLGAMGDVLRSKCLLPGLKRQYPQSWITWLTLPGSEPIVRDPTVDEVRVLNDTGLLALEGRRFDVLLCLDKDPPAVALARRIEATHKFGYAPTPYNTVTVWNEGAVHALRMGLSDDLKYRQNTLTHQQILYRMAELEYRGDEYDLVVPAAAQETADTILARVGVPAGRPVVGLNTGCGPAFETKQWDIGQMSGFLERIARTSDASVLLLGGGRERETHRALLDAAGPLAGTRVFDTGNDNSLEVFFGLTNRADVVVAADSLGMHVAIALKRQVVAFFGPTCEQEVDLFGRGEKLVTDFACSPCYLKRCDVRPSCMMAMSAADVVGAVLRAIEREAARS